MSDTIAILGGRGMLGSDLAEVCKQQGYEVNIFDLPEFDITNTEQLKSAVDGAGLIVNCAAYTNVDGAQSQSELAHAVNGYAVGELGALARKTNKRVLHISTDFVFDGQLDRPYLESDQPNPINEYGKSKLLGERLLVESGCDHCIIRVEWTYGSAGNNFITKVIELAKDRDELKIVDDQIGSPTATTEVAEVICQLLKEQVEGVFHFANSGYVSRYDVAKFICDKLGKRVDLKSCKTTEYKTPAKRPLNSRFCCDKIQGLLDKAIRPWEETLEGFLEQL